MTSHVAIYLKDLTFMNDGNESMTNGMVNFAKLRMMGDRVLEVKNLASCMHDFREVPAIQNYLKKPLVSFDYKYLQEQSRNIEPSN